MLASPYILKEKVGKESIVALIIAIIGVYLVIHPDRGFKGFEFSESYYIGIVSGLFSGILSAFYIMNIKILKRNYSEFAIAFWTTALCCLLMSPYAFEPSLNVLAANIFPLMASGIFIVGIGGILTTIGFANLKSQTGSLLSLIQLIAGVFFDLTVLGVTLPAGTIEGCLLVLVASVIVSLSDSPKTSIKLNACVKIVEDSYKSLLRVRRWIMPLYIFTIRIKK
jgi:drug/metabolite transporter (DMT)-like permease